MEYISSLSAKVEKFNQLIRSHWGIENKLHWVLDVNFNEDTSRIRKGHADQNMSIIKRIALNIIKKHHNKKLSIKRKRYKLLLMINLDIKS
ncbi:MAG: ISAs1 family transposase [Polaribacter sp.]